MSPTPDEFARRLNAARDKNGVRAVIAEYRAAMAAESTHTLSNAWNLWFCDSADVALCLASDGAP